MTPEQKTKRKETSKRYYQANRQTVLAAAKKWRIDNPEKAQESQRRSLERNREYARVWRGVNREKNRARVKQWQLDNPEKSKACTRAWMDANPEKMEEYKQKRRLARRGITSEQHGEMLTRQNGGCAICLTPFGSLTPHIDHCHTTGQVRGLLCFACNSMLGFAKDSQSTLLKAIGYLQK